MGKQRREQSQDSIFVDNPFVDGFLEWMGSREGRQCIEVRDVLWDLLEDAELDAKQRQLIWPDAERLDLVQSIQRIQKLYPDFPGHEIEEVLLNWIDMGYDPENYSQAQLNELDSLTERWVADHLRNANASKTRKRTRRGREDAASLDRPCARRLCDLAVGAEECSRRGSNKRME